MWDGMIMELLSTSPKHKPHNKSWDGGMSYVPILLHNSKMGLLDQVPYHVKTWFCCRALCRLLEHLQGRGWVVNPQNIADPGTAIVLGSHLMGKMCIVPEAMIDKVQAPIQLLKTWKRCNLCREFLFGEFLFSTWPFSLILPGKERALLCVGLGIRAASCF